MLHQTANSIVFQQTGRKLVVFSADTNRARELSKSYKVAERINKVEYHVIKNSYNIADKQLLIVDSLGVLPEHHNPEIVLLTQSVKVNLERYLTKCTPQLIIADGSNYLNYIDRWRMTCMKRNIPFHYTGEKGAFYFSNAN